MANDITYEIVGSAPGSITVRYRLGENYMDLPLPYTGEGDVDEFIGRYTPRQHLEAMQVPAANHSALVGKTGTPKEPEKGPPTPPEPSLPPPETPAS